MAHRQIRTVLAAVTASLIGASEVDAEFNRSEASILIYKEKDRTSATEVNFGLTKQLKNNFLINLRLTFDGLTGATPTGASPSKYPQTITRASGGTIVQIPAGQHPFDEYFKDNRFAGDASISHPVGQLSDFTLGLHGSSEHDYKSLGINSGITRDFLNRRTKLGISGSYSKDKVAPVGGFKDPFAEVGVEVNETAEEYRKRFDGKPKRVYGAVLSVDHVLTWKTILRLNISVNWSDGYLTDPYKILSVVQSPDTTDPGEPITSLYEKRPNTRAMNAAYAQIRRQFEGSAADLAYRYYWDDWGIESHSVEVSWLMDFNRAGSFQPHVRWYHRSEADFYTPFLVDGDQLPAYASADSRLAEFTAYTLGLGYSVPVKPNTRLKFTIEYYLQRGNSSPPNNFDVPLTFDLFPKLDVVMVRLGYSHDF